jgi:hypothetical protein
MSLTSEGNCANATSDVDNGYKLYVGKTMYTITKDASMLARETNVAFLMQIPMGFKFKDVLVFSIKQNLFIFYGSMNCEGNVDSYAMYQIPQVAFAECAGTSFEDKLRSFVRSGGKMSFRHVTTLSTFLVQADIILDDEDETKVINIEYWPKLIVKDQM